MSAYSAIIQRFHPGARLLDARPLAGGVSAEVTALEIAHPDGRAETVVLRRHGAADLARDPEIAAHEFRLLQALQAAGVPAPAPLHLDTGGALLPTPFLLQGFIDGDTEDGPADLDDRVRQVAGALAAIHRVPPPPFLPLQEAQAAALIARHRPEPDESLAEPRLRAALAAHWPPPRRNPAVLLHGDVWPGNLLWRGGRLRAVVDWEDAAAGDPLADLANARLELFLAEGEDAMAALTRHYLADAGPAVDPAALPLWELWAALRPVAGLPGWGLDPAEERRLRRRHRAFTGRALAQVGG